MTDFSKRTKARWHRRVLYATTHPATVGKTIFYRALNRWAARDLSRRGLIDFLDARPADAYQADSADLWFLYRTVRRIRPLNILEFGSGCSTAIFAQALRDNESEYGLAGRILSIDNNEHWAEVTRRSLPESVRRICEVVYRRIEPTEFAGRRVWRHVDLPRFSPDFVYLDGPAYPKGTPHDEKVAMDLLELEARFPKGFLMIADGRRHNCAFLAKHFRRAHRIRRNPIFRNRSFQLVE